MYAQPAAATPNQSASARAPVNLSTLDRPLPRRTTPADDREVEDRRGQEQQHLRLKEAVLDGARGSRREHQETGRHADGQPEHHAASDRRRDVRQRAIGEDEAHQPKARDERSTDDHRQAHEMNGAQGANQHRRSADGSRPRGLFPASSGTAPTCRGICRAHRTSSEYWSGDEERGEPIDGAVNTLQHRDRGRALGKRSGRVGDLREKIMDSSVVRSGG